MKNFSYTVLPVFMPIPTKFRLSPEILSNFEVARVEEESSLTARPYTPSCSLYRDYHNFDLLSSFCKRQVEIWALQVYVAQSSELSEIPKFYIRKVHIRVVYLDLV